MPLVALSSLRFNRYTRLVPSATRRFGLQPSFRNNFARIFQIFSKYTPPLDLLLTFAVLFLDCRLKYLSRPNIRIRLEYCRVSIPSRWVHKTENNNKTLSNRHNFPLEDSCLVTALNKTHPVFKLLLINFNIGLTTYKPAKLILDVG